MDNQKLAENLKRQIEETNNTINLTAEQISELKNENIRLTEQKRQIEILRNQLRMAEDRNKSLADEAMKLKEANLMIRNDLTSHNLTTSAPVGKKQ